MKNSCADWKSELAEKFYDWNFEIAESFIIFRILGVREERKVIGWFKLWFHY